MTDTNPEEPRSSRTSPRRVAPRGPHYDDAEAVGRALGALMREVPTEGMRRLLRAFKRGVEQGEGGILTDLGMMMSLTLDGVETAYRRRLAMHLGLDLAPAPIPVSDPGDGVTAYHKAINDNLIRLTKIRPDVADEVLGWMHWLDDKVSTIVTILEETGDPE